MTFCALSSAKGMDIKMEGYRLRLLYSFLFRSRHYIPYYTYLQNLYFRM